MTELRAMTVVLDGALTITSADAVRTKLLAALAETDLVEVDCSAAAEVDISFIQLMVAARRSCGSLTLKSPASGALLAALKRGGFLAQDLIDTADSRFWTKGEG